MDKKQPFSIGLSGPVYPQEVVPAPGGEPLGDGGVSGSPYRPGLLRAAELAEEMAENEADVDGPHGTAWLLMLADRLRAEAGEG